MPRFPWPLASLRTYLIAAILVAALPTAAYLSFQIVAGLTEQLRHIDEDLDRSASLLAGALERDLAATVEALQLLAQSEALAASDLDRFATLLRERPVPHRRPRWTTVVLLDADGVVLLDSAGAGMPAPPAADPLAVQVSRVVPTGQGDAAVFVGVPVAGRPLRLGAWIDTRHWQPQLERFRPRYDGRIVVRDDAGQVVARTTGEAGGPEADEAGDDLHARWVPVAMSNWSVGVSVPSAPIERQHRSAMLAAFGIASLCLLAGTAAALWVARRVTHPLERLGAGLPEDEPIAVREIASLQEALARAAREQAQARTRLQSQADEFEVLFRSSPIGLAFAQDREGAQVMLNDALAGLLGPAAGGTAGEAAGVAGAAAPPAAAPPVLQGDGRQPPLAVLPLARAAATGQASGDVELEIERGAGQAPRVVIARTVPLFDEIGAPRGAIAAVLDITERKRTEARLLEVDRRLREAQGLVDLAEEAGQVGFFRYLPASDTLTVTRGCASMLGLDAERPQPLGDLLGRLHPEDRGAVEQAIERLRTAGVETDEVMFRLRPGGESVPRWLSTRLLMRFDEQGLARQLVGVVLDVSEHQQAQQQRGALVAREQAARRQAEAANQAKDEFLAMLGHELRNPLNAIASAAEVLNLRGGGDETTQDARSIIVRQTRHLSHLMDDLLDVARVASGKAALSRVPTELGRLVAALVETMKLGGDAARHAVTVAVDEVWADVDATRIEQVVGNLLGNALKYTPAGGSITVRARREGAQAVIEVADTGVGIPPDLLPRAFDLFVQGERTLDRGAGGLGVGLTLVQRLVTLHGGRVEAESSPAGSVFRVWLPATERPAPSRAVAPPPPVEARSVLVVEDNDDALQALRAALRLDGHEVGIAHDGPEGLQRLLDTRPEVALLDIGLPGLTGYEVARQARGAGYAGRLIALSGYGDDGSVQKALRAGFDAYLPKPVDFDRLRELLGRVDA